MSQGPQFWGNVAQWVSAVATVAGFTLAILALFRLRRVERVLEFDRRYKEHREFIQTFWTVLGRAWQEYRRSHQELPSEVDSFIRQVGVPPRLPPKTRDIRNWRAENAARLTPHQERMLEFVSGIYPERKDLIGAVWQHSAIKPEDDAKVFHVARGELAWFWDTEASVVRKGHFRRHHTGARDLLIQIAWLEIALHEWTDTHGLGKIRLFKVLQATWRTRVWWKILQRTFTCLTKRR